VVARNSKHRNKIVAALNEAGLRAAGLEEIANEEYNVIVLVSGRESRAVNGAQRFHVLIKCEYACSPEDDVQTLGRLTRIGQKATVIFHITLVVAGSPQEKLMMAHDSVIKQQMSMQASIMCFRDADALLASLAGA
jgi:hypothetical protein